MRPPLSLTVHRPRNEGVVADPRTWIANGSGLLVRQEEDIETGLGDQRHVSLWFEYANLRLPAGVK